MIQRLVPFDVEVLYNYKGYLHFSHIQMPTSSKIHLLSSNKKKIATMKP